MSWKNFWWLLVFLGIVFLIGWLGSMLTATSVQGWYQGLQKSSLTPPSWVFGPVWTILYVSIAISGWLVFINTRSSRKKRVVFLIYGLQLLFNLLWFFFFFYLKNPAISLLDIFLLDVFIVWNIICFLKLHRLAGALLIPYLLWTFYATMLNFLIWDLNR